MTNALSRGNLNAPSLSIALLALLACSFAGQSGANEATADQADSQASFEQLVNGTMNLQASEIITLDIDPTPGIDRSIAVTIDGEEYTLELERYSVRAAGYQVLAQYPDGELVEMEPSPVRTVRGTVVELADSIVAGSVQDDGLHVMIKLDEDNTYWIEPLSDRIAGAAAGEHVLYHAHDIISSGGTCGNDAAAMEDHVLSHGDKGDSRQAMGGEVCGVTELACDADVEYFNDYGSVPAVESRINQVITAVNVQYMSQVEIEHVITTIIVRTSEPDPYSSTDPGTLLSQFRSEWLNNQGGIPRDVAHLFTGKNINGGVIGIAWDIGAICTSGAYCLSESDFNNNFSCATDLTAHELGHLWGAFHCSCPSFTMNPSITCANQFSSGSITSITNHRNSRNCLDCPEPGTTTLPFFDDFPTQVIDTSLWTGNDGAIINGSGAGEPSGSFSLNVDGADEIRSAIMDTSDPGLLVLSYWWQRTGDGGSPEPGEDLFVEYRNAANDWVVLNTHPGDGPDDDPYEFVEMALPAGAHHAGFRLRFRAEASTNQDDFFVDDVFIGAPPEDETTTLPFVDEFPSTEIDSALWIGVEGATIDDQGTDEPSAPFSLNIDGIDEIRSANMDTTGEMDLTLNYSWQQGCCGGDGEPDAPELADPLKVEYLNDLDEWVEINSHPGGGPTVEPYESVSLALPGDAYHGSFRFRFRGTGTPGGEPEGFDDWFVDDVCVGTLGECQTGQACNTPADCDDGFACTTEECLSNFCVITPSDIACDDGIGCTADSCVVGSGCQNTPDNGACDDGDECTVDSCDAGSGCVNEPGNCVSLEAVQAILPICQDTSQDFIDEPLDVCKVYARLTSVNDRLLSVGFSEINASNGAFYHHPLLGNSPLAPFCDQIATFPDLVCDSFVTIGVECGEIDPANSTATDGDFSLSEFLTNGHIVGGWFNSNPPNGQGDPGPDQRVLIAQLSVAQGATTAGTLIAYALINGETLEFPDLAFLCEGGPTDCNVGCPTDINFDGFTNAPDLAQLLGCWGPVAPDTPCECLDLDASGSIDPVDLAGLLGVWGACP